MELEALAKLSNVTLTDKEFVQLEKDFKAAMEKVAPILSVKAPDIPIYSTAVEIKTLRADVVKPSLSIERALGTSNKRGRYFVVPQVVE